MFESASIIKHTGGAPRAAGPDFDEAATGDGAHYLGGVIRDSRAQMQVRTFTVDGPDWAADVPLPAPQSAAGPTAASAPPPQPADLDALRAEWEATFRRQADAEREAAVTAAREAAYAEGYAAAESTLRPEFEAARAADQAALADDLARLRALWNEHLAAVDPHLVGLAVDVAEAVLDGPVSEEDRAATSAAITSAVEQLAGRPPLVVSLHPVDHLRLQETGLAEGLAASHPGLRWVPDPHLAEGDWSLDAAGAAIRRVRAEVLLDLRARLGLMPHDGLAETDTPEAE